MTKLRSITEAQIDSMYEAWLDHAIEEQEQASQEALDEAQARARTAETWLSMPIHEDEPHQRTVTLPEYVCHRTRMSAITVRHYERRPIWHTWAGWDFMLAVNS